MMKVDRNDKIADAFHEAEITNLRAWMKLSRGQKVGFFEEMIELAYHSGGVAA